MNKTVGGPTNTTNNTNATNTDTTNTTSTTITGASHMSKRRYTCLCGAEYLTKHSLDRHRRGHESEMNVLESRREALPMEEINGEEMMTEVYESESDAEAGEVEGNGRVVEEVEANEASYYPFPDINTALFIGVLQTNSISKRAGQKILDLAHTAGVKMNLLPGKMARIQDIVQRLPFQEHQLMQVRQVVPLRKGTNRKTLAEFKKHSIPPVVRTVGIVYRGLINIIKMMFGSAAMR